MSVLRFSIIVFSVVILIGAAALVTLHRQQFTYAIVSVHAPKRNFSLQVADTEAKQDLGLGQRERLAADQGMVFTYDKPRQLCFWMKDMRFAIDMLWLNSDKTVTRLEPAVSPSTYPQNFCADQAQYVIELPSGAAASSGIKTGSQLQF